MNVWDFEKLAQSCRRVAPEEGAALLREMLHSGDVTVHRHAAAVLGSFVGGDSDQSEFNRDRKTL
jgi:hypothetical protein